MAFKYSDGLIYESDFHYWYVNGCKPVKEFKVEIREGGIERSSAPAREGSPVIHPVHELSGRLRVRGKGRDPEWC